jgi:hypothetical protein
VQRIEQASRPRGHRRALQRVIEVFSVPLAGERYLRRPAAELHAHGLRIERQQRFRLGIVERVCAVKPA